MFSYMYELILCEAYCVNMQISSNDYIPMNINTNLKTYWYIVTIIITVPLL